MNEVIRRAEERDIHEIAELEKLCFPTPWSEQSFRDEIIKNAIAVYMVTEDQNLGRIVGYAGLWRILDEGHVTNVAIHPDYRGRGLGKKMMEELLRCVEDQAVCRETLEVRISNEAAIRMYYDLGFREAGRRKGYYEDNGEDAIIMWRE